MFSKFERKVAFRYLRAKKQDGFVSLITVFSLIGITLGVAVLISTMSVMNGFRRELESRMLGMQGHVNIFGNYAPIAENNNINLDFPEIKHNVPFVEGQVMATANNIATGSLIKGWTTDSLRKKELISDSLDERTIQDFENKNGVILGVHLARKLRIRVGDNVTLISPAGRSTVMGFIPRMKAYEVVGLFEIGMYEYDNATIIMPLKQAQIYFQLKEKLSGIELILNDFQQAGALATKLSETIGSEYRAVSWEQTNVQFFNALKVERNVMFFILTLIIAIAVLNVVSSMIMLVKDKGQDIAILRTMGATRKSIMKIFFLCGASIGVIGTIAGFGLGLAFSLNIETIEGWLESLSGTTIFDQEIYYLSSLPSQVKSEDVIWVVIVSLSLSFITTLYPSIRAARLNPVEALRYE